MTELFDAPNNWNFLKILKLFKKTLIFKSKNIFLLRNISQVLQQLKLLCLLELIAINEGNY